MIYNWTPFLENIKLVECDKKDAQKHVTKGVELKSGLYFLIDVTNKYLCGEKSRYVHPSVNDVMVAGDKTYALQAIVECRRHGSVWAFKLLVRELVKEKMAPTKSFGIESTQS